MPPSETPALPEGYELFEPKVGEPFQDDWMWRKKNPTFGVNKEWSSFLIPGAGKHTVSGSVLIGYEYCRPIQKPVVTASCNRAPDGAVLCYPRAGDIMPPNSYIWLPDEKIWWTLIKHEEAHADRVYAIPTHLAQVAVSGDTKAPQEESVLQEAERLIHGDRQQSYGAAHKSFNRIAKLWTAYLEEKLAHGGPITPKDVASMMILMKVSRSVTSNKRDNWVDIAGYSGLAADIEACETAPE
jgi:hypothetical protein